MAKPKNQRKRNIERFKQILDANLLSPTPGRDPKVKYYAPRAPQNVSNVKLPKIPEISVAAQVPTDRKTDLAQYLLAAAGGTSKSGIGSIEGVEGASQEKPGLLNRIFDAASGPL